MNESLDTPKVRAEFLTLDVGVLICTDYVPQVDIGQLSLPLLL